MKNNTENLITEVWPGPMEGVMKNAFIRTVSQLKLVSRWMTPFYRVSSHVPKMRQIDEFLEPFLSTGLPVSGQIMGNDAKMLSKTAELMLSAGCIDVNLNCGCPSNRVISGNSGGGALKDIQQLSYIIRHLRDTIEPGKFSIKSRIGYDRIQMQEILHTLISEGKPDRLFVHCRTVKEMYMPIPDIEARFDEIIQLTSSACESGMKLILNGDIDSLQRALRLASNAKGCGIMAARAWMKNPGLLREFEGKSVEDCGKLKQEFFDVFSQFNHAEGANLEIARLLWGANSNEFKTLCSNLRR